MSKPSRVANGSVLVVGVYIPTAINNTAAIVRELEQATLFSITQRWIANGAPPLPQLASVTCWSTSSVEPQFPIRNAVLAREHLDTYEYVLHIEDDIILPERFVDRFLSLQLELDFAIAQPARTADSFAGIPFVLQMPAVKARQTNFVECGPLVAFHRRAYDMVFPFDERSPMGWGYGQVWGHRAKERGLKIGIIDCLPVDHSIRPQYATYDRYQAGADKNVLLKTEPHLSFTDALTNVTTIPL